MLKYKPSLNIENKKILLNLKMYLLMFWGAWKNSLIFLGGGLGGEWKGTEIINFVLYLTFVSLHSF